MIIRNDVGDYTRTEDAKGQRTERKPADWDLAWMDHKVYVLDANEWFDPHTSGHYSENGVSRHAMFGPATIVVSCCGGLIKTVETHVNDPHTWAWVRRSIAEGYLTKDTMKEGIDHESLVHIVG